MVIKKFLNIAICHHAEIMLSTQLPIRNGRHGVLILLLPRVNISKNACDKVKLIMTSILRIAVACKGPCDR